MLRPRSLLSHLTLRSLAASLNPLGCRLKRLVRKMTSPLEGKDLKRLTPGVSPNELASRASSIKTDHRAPLIHLPSNQLPDLSTLQ